MSVAIDIKQRILWLSDIHYLKEYENKTKEFKQYIDTFLEECNELNKKTKIDYVLISGDIAQSGEEREYELFKEDILDKLFAIIPDARLLIVPGNHDVSRTNISYFESYFSTTLDKYDFLRDNPDAFQNIFQFYREAFLNHPRIPNNNELSSNYKAQLFHGFLKDDEKKTIFVLLNSSWYSFGYDSLVHYIEEQIIGTGKTKLDSGKLAKDITQRTQEYGNQIIGMNVFHELDVLENKLKNYPEYFVITVMHHPVNWLFWEERIYYNQNKIDRFYNLKQKTHLILTGHEHVRASHQFDIQNNQQRIHIPAGAFIEVREKTEEELREEEKANKKSVPSPKKEKNTKKEKVNTYDIKNTMFSILDINVKKRLVSNTKFTYDGKKWKKFKDVNEFKLEKNYLEELQDQRKNLILKKIKNRIDSKTIIQKMYPNTITLDSSANYFKNKNNELLIFIEKDFNLDTTELKKTIKTHKFQIINFIFIDLKFDEGKMYQKGNDRLQVLNKIKTKMELKFNGFRHKFFSNPKAHETLDFKDLKFVLVVKPYWEIEFLL